MLLINKFDQNCKNFLQLIIFIFLDFLQFKQCLNIIPVGNIDLNYKNSLINKCLKISFLNNSLKKLIKVYYKNKNKTYLMIISVLSIYIIPLKFRFNVILANQHYTTNLKINVYSRFNYEIQCLSHFCHFLIFRIKQIFVKC